MATLFDNAHIHYHPLMFVYLIWLDCHVHKGASRSHWCCLRVEGNSSESQTNVMEVCVAQAAFSNQGRATESDDAAGVNC